MSLYCAFNTSFKLQTSRSTSFVQSLNILFHRFTKQGEIFHRRIAEKFTESKNILFLKWLRGPYWKNICPRSQKFPLAVVRAFGEIVTYASSTDTVVFGLLTVKKNAAPHNLSFSAFLLPAFHSWQSQNSSRS